MKKIAVLLLAIGAQAQEPVPHDSSTYREAVQYNSPTYKAMGIMDLTDAQELRAVSTAASVESTSRGAIAHMPKVKVKNTALKQRNLLGILSKARRAVLNDIIARSTYRLSARLRKSINHFEEMNNRFDALIMGYVLEEPLGALEKIFLHDYLDLNNSYDTLVLSQFFSASAHQATREQIENFKKEVKKKNDDFNQFIKIFILDSRPDNANKKRFLARLKAIENEFTTFINQLS